jgi:hypothetical protein
VESCEVEDLVSMYGRVLSRDEGVCRQKKKSLFGRGSVRSDRVIVMCQTSIENSRYKLRREISLRGGKCGGQYKRGL